MLPEWRSKRTSPSSQFRARFRACEVPELLCIRPLSSASECRMSRQNGTLASRAFSEFPRPSRLSAGARIFLALSADEISCIISHSVAWGDWHASERGQHRTCQPTGRACSYDRRHPAPCSHEELAREDPLSSRRAFLVWRVRQSATPRPLRLLEKEAEPILRDFRTTASDLPRESVRCSLGSGCHAGIHNIATCRLSYVD